jgi:hypothetical protein
VGEDDPKRAEILRIVDERTERYPMKNMLEYATKGTEPQRNIIRRIFRENMNGVGGKRTRKVSIQKARKRTRGV